MLSLRYFVVCMGQKFYSFRRSHFIHYVVFLGRLKGPVCQYVVSRVSEEIEHVH